MSRPPTDPERELLFALAFGASCAAIVYWMLSLA
jgi:hypothetical protein